MKNKKFKLIFLCIIFIVVAIWFVNFATERHDKYDEKYKIVSNINEYYEVASGVNKFYQFYNDLFLTEADYDYGSLGSEIDNDSIDYTESINNVYSLLDKEYIEFSGMTKENLKEKIEQHQNTSYIHIDSMHRICKQESLSLYYIKATLIDKNELNHEKLDLLLKKYNFNNTFSIYLSDYIQNYGYNNLEIGQKSNIKLQPVQTNIINLYEKKEITEAQYVKDLFNDYKNNCLYNIEYAYETLDEEFKKEKFDTFKKYDEYILKNITKVITMKFNGYNLENNNGVSKYTCIDTENNRYVFITTAPMQYKIVIESN